MSNNKLNDYLFDAVQNGNGKRVRYLLEIGANVFMEKNGKTIFDIAKELKDEDLINIVYEGAVRQFENLIKGDNEKEIIKGINRVLAKDEAYKDIKSQELGEKLVKSILSDDVVTALKLIEQDADVNFRLCDGDTPLTISSAKGYEEVVKKLLDKGAYVDIKTGRSRSTPLLRAVDYSRVEVIDILLKHGANTNYTNNDGDNILDLACIRGNVEIVKMLLDNGADINGKKGFNDNTPIMTATRFGSIACVNELLSRGADISIKNCYGCDAIGLAKDRGNRVILSVLIEHKNSLKAKNANNEVKKGFFSKMFWGR